MTSEWDVGQAGRGGHHRSVWHSLERRQKRTGKAYHASNVGGDGRFGQTQVPFVRHQVFGTRNSRVVKKDIEVWKALAQFGGGGHHASRVRHIQLERRHEVFKSKLTHMKICVRNSLLGVPGPRRVGLTGVEPRPLAKRRLAAITNRCGQLVGIKVVQVAYPARECGRPSPKAGRAFQPILCLLTTDGKTAS